MPLTGTEALDRLLSTQKPIRIFVDLASDFGNLAANVNLIKYLDNLIQERGLSDFPKIELIYPKGTVERLTVLFNSKFVAKGSFQFGNFTIKTINYEQFSKNLAGGRVKPCDLALSARLAYKDLPDYLEKRYSHYVKEMDHGFSLAPASKLESFRTYLNADSVIVFDNFYATETLPEGGYYQDTVIFDSTGRRTLADSAHKTIKFPTVKFMDETFQQAIRDSRPLQELTARIADQSVYYQALYGYPLYYGGANVVLKLLAAARQAQLKSPQLRDKPLVMTLHYPSYHDTAENTDRLLAKASKRAYNPEINELTDRFKLTGNVRVVKLDDPQLSRILKKIKPGKILLVYTDRLPQQIFEGLMTHQGPNVLPTVLEGASTFATIAQTRSTPHLHCVVENGNDWPVILNDAPDALLPMFQKLHHTLCSEDLEHLDAVDVAAQYYVDSMNPSSDLSTFFQSLHTTMMDESNDRYRGALISVAEANQYAAPVGAPLILQYPNAAEQVHGALVAATFSAALLKKFSDQKTPSVDDRPMHKKSRKAFLDKLRKKMLDMEHQLEDMKLNRYGNPELLKFLDERLETQKLIYAHYKSSSQMTVSQRKELQRGMKSIVKPIKGIRLEHKRALMKNTFFPAIQLPKYAQDYSEVIPLPPIKAYSYQANKG